MCSGAGTCFSTTLIQRELSSLALNAIEYGECGCNVWLIPKNNSLGKEGQCFLGVNSFGAKLFLIAFRASARLANSPEAIACIATLPIRVDSVGPAEIMHPVVSAAI